jgi:hypothetical protein
MRRCRGLRLAAASVLRRDRRKQPANMVANRVRLERTSPVKKGAAAWERRNHREDLRDRERLRGPTNSGNLVWRCCRKITELFSGSV